MFIANTGRRVPELSVTATNPAHDTHDEPPDDPSLIALAVA